jgi:hypothetical protein
MQYCRLSREPINSLQMPARVIICEKEKNNKASFNETLNANNQT